MKITKAYHSAIARAVMSGVDGSEIKSLRDEAQRIVEKVALNFASPEFAALFHTEKGRQVLMSGYGFNLSMNAACNSLYVQLPDVKAYMEPAPDKSWTQPFTDATKEVVERFEAIAVERYEMALRVEAAVASCSTVKQLVERYPEWEKFLPDELTHKANKTTALADANLIPDLVKLGWPDGGKPKAVAVVAEVQQ